MAEKLLLILMVILIIGLVFVVIGDSYIRKEDRIIMLVISGLIMSLIIRNLVDYQLDVDWGNVLLRILCSVYGYSIRPVILILFGSIVSKNKKTTLAWILVAINAAINMTAFWSGICFTFDSRTGFIRGPLGYTSHIVSALLLIHLVMLSVSKYRDVKRFELFILFFNAAVIITAVFVDTFVILHDTLFSYLDAAMVSGSLFYYFWLHLQFVREHESALKADQRMQIMLSQIQPHFLYNTLAVIQNLCRKDPVQAEEATIRFARYLRGNMDSLLKEGAIPFEQELKHTREYLELEKMRFQKKLVVRYKINCTGFTLPPLTLQPIAENAVRHGIRGNPEGSGEVTIETWERPDCYEIAVTDNGPGFDPAAIPLDKEESHIGIQNVRERLASISRGKLIIQSSVGKGTTVFISLPKEVHTE